MLSMSDSRNSCVDRKLLLRAPSEFGGRVLERSGLAASERVIARPLSTIYVSLAKRPGTAGSNLGSTSLLPFQDVNEETCPDSSLIDRTKNNQQRQSTFNRNMLETQHVSLAKEGV